VKLGFDATSLTTTGKGLARFQREFLRAADELDLIEELDVFVPPGADLGDLPERPGWRYHVVKVSPMVAWEQLGCPLMARRLGLDATITLSERSALWGPPEVVYIYEHPKYRARRARAVGVALRQRAVDLLTLALFAVARRRAAVLLAASASTGRDIGTSRVVHSGVSPDFSPGTGERTYFLHIASDDPRDNSAVVVDAYAAYGPGAPPLVVAGPIDAARPALEERAARLRVEVEWRGFVSGDALVEAYRGAIAYVDPSLYEGFGLQAAEALACGTPVIASNTTSLPEVVGDGGILLDPHDVDGFARALHEVADDPGRAAELGRRAVEQARRFTWETTARGVLAACAELDRAG
jgi:glycosyltransferase involved in cell wall biosynthesis